MAEVVTIPLGGVDYAGNPLPPQGQYITPGGGPSGGFPAALLPYSPPQQTAGPPLTGEQFPKGLIPYSGPPAPSAAEPVGGVEAAGLGAIQGASFGAYPMIHGAAEASGIEAPRLEEGPQAPLAEQGDPLAALKYIGATIGRPIVGAARMAAGAPGATEAYTTGREQAQKRVEQAGRDQPAAYYGSQIAGGLAVTPALGPLASLRAATIPGRIAQGVKVGGVTGGLFGAGEAGSRGESPANVAIEGAKGAGVGAGLGGFLGSTIEGVSGAAGRVASIVRGKRDPELEAGRQVVQSLREGAPAASKVIADQPALQAGQEAGTPLFVGDVGGQSTRRLLRKSTNISPEAQETAAGRLTGRFQGQADRISEWLLSKFGGGDVGQTLDNLKQAARQSNRPNYARAYAQGDRQIWTPELERLTAAPYVQAALRQAMSKWKNYVVRDGFGAMNPPFRVERGGLVQVGGRGLPVFPNLQLWDYAARDLQDRARAAPPGSQQAALLNDLARLLKDELDKIVPSYGLARGVAARYFGANDALEAGEKFASASGVGGRTIRDPEVARMVAQMPPAERALFQYGFVTELANKVRGTGDNRNVVNAIANNPNARRRIEVALGRGGADEVDALMRIEGLIDRSRTAVMGNSSTGQQIHDISTGAAVGAGASLNPIYIIAGLLTYGGRKAAREIDQQVANRVAEMLTSEDPRVFRRGLEVVSKNPVMRDALRRASDLSVREIISIFGPGGTAALGTMAGKHMLSSSPAPEQHGREHYYSGEDQSP